MRPCWRTIAAGLALSIVATGSAAAFHSVEPAGPTPDPDDLGLDENDVRDEASHPEDDNGFPGAQDGAFWSPKTDPLVLDAYLAPGDKYHRWASADVDNVLNRAQHGENYRSQERTMYPGSNRFAAWWGWWSDTGGGGDLQAGETRALPGVGEPNGAIDDADDCSEADWDEFTHRGANDCAASAGHAAYPDDQMFAFVQPGTHDLHFNSFYDALASYADDAAVPDFEYMDYHQRWEEAPRVGGLEYDASLLVATKVATAVNPLELSTDGEATAFDPGTPAGDAGDYALDVDLYTTPHPLVEQAYRTAVWDPGDEVASPADAVHEEGLKEWAKDTVPEAQDEAADQVVEAQEQALAPTERQRGVADDLVSGPYFHEPNTPDDVYGIASDGTTATWATHDPATSYGGLEGAYYDPGPDQAYPGYADGERFWTDAKIAVNSLPAPIAWGFNEQVTPEIPDPEAPVESTVREDDDNTQGPGFLYMEATVGTWHDANGDGWVGDAGADGHPYDNGTTDDPHDYGSPEFRGSCEANLQTTLHPTTDTDGDGVKDWGAAGVYVIEPFLVNYGSPWMDVVGTTAEPLQDQLRDTLPLGSLLLPERERLEQYRRTGPIHLDTWIAFCDDASSGFHQGRFTVVLPTGTLDFGFEAVTHLELTDQGRLSQHGDNQDESLAGQKVVDVDRVKPVVQSGTT